MKMSNKSFVRELKEFLKTKINTKPTYDGVKLLDLDKVEPKNGFIIEINGEKFVLRIYDTHYKSKEACYLNLLYLEKRKKNNSLLQYTLDDSNFVIDKDHFVLKQNRGITIRTKRKGLKKESEDLMVKLGFNKNNIILRGDLNNKNFELITRDLFKWLRIRATVKLQLEDKYRKNDDGGIVVKKINLNNGQDKKESKNKSNISSRNLILYGPPGTGKTYSTIDIAADIINNNEFKEGLIYSEEEHKANSKTFNKHLQKRIHFLTFHQNYSYEEFVGGIRPQLGDGNLSFEWKPGVFMKASVAAYKIAKKGKLDNEITDEDVNEFLDYCNSQKEIDNDFQTADKVVLIIDEINRANISRVFGELITLIEDDKRIGGTHQLILSLPDGKKFGVPANLVIIGTMNTADKSIALLDIALRRRFEFVQMNVNYELEGLMNFDLLKKINHNLELKKESQDYNIGHSFFMKKDDVEFNLKETMNKKVIPLLYEYFMGDKKEVLEILNGFCDFDENKENSFAMPKFKSQK